MKLIAALCGCIALMGLGPVQRTALPFGSQLVILRDPAVPTVALELWFRAPSTGYDEPTPGLARYAATAIAATKLPGGQTLSGAIKNAGGRFSISDYPDAVAVAASVPAGSEARILKLMTTAYFTPVLSADGMRTGLRDVVVAGTQRRFDPEGTLRDAVFAQLFAAGPAHYSTLPAAAVALSHVTLENLRTFSARAFRSSNAVIAIAGNAQLDVAASVGGARADGLAMDAPVDSKPAPPGAPATGAFGENAVGLGWTGPPISDPKAATALDFIADYLFRPDAGVVSQALARANTDVFLNGTFVTLHDPGVMLVQIAGKDSQSARDRVLAAIAKMQSPLDPATFLAARKAFEYHILADTQTPLGQADNFGWYAVEGDARYSPSDDGRKYLTVAESLDPAYVARIARQYLGTPAVVELTGSSK